MWIILRSLSILFINFSPVQVEWWPAVPSLSISCPHDTVRKPLWTWYGWGVLPVAWTCFNVLIFDEPFDLYWFLVHIDVVQTIWVCFSAQMMSVEICLENITQTGFTMPVSISIQMEILTSTVQITAERRKERIDKYFKCYVCI